LGLCRSEWKSGICNYDIIYGTNVKKCHEINDIANTQASMTINVDINVKIKFDITANNEHDNNVKICGGVHDAEHRHVLVLVLDPRDSFGLWIVV